ncbi:hypothetical protein MMC07_009788 [Pseudocyphellaria aurata]|nr:hypothetical protein [Pseudocyphellaria aurata]
MNPKYVVAASREEDDISNHHAPTEKEKKRVFCGWRFGIIGGSLSVFVVLVLNLSFTLWTHSQRGFTNKRGILHEGHCDEIRRLNVAAHVMINIFSTVILASSNYCMQCLSAPTRAEIDKAHARGVWLDVGIPSMRNLRRISGKRALLWSVLGLSSLPLHLFYNSVIFSSIATNNYVTFTVNSAFVDATSIDDVDIPASIKPVAVGLHEAARNGSKSLQPLNNSACIQAYAHDFLSDRSNLLLIASDANSTSTPAVFSTTTTRDISTGCGSAAYSWICAEPYYSCNDPCQSHLSEVLADAEHWHPYHAESEVASEVKYCLSQKTPEHCKLQFSLQIVIVVIVINTLKLVLMVYVVFGLKETPLMTVGDAVASFLNKQDPTTRGCCLVSKFDIKVNKLRWQYRDGESNAPVAKEWLPTKVRWARAVSRTRWWSCGLMISLAVTVCSVLLCWGLFVIMGPKDLGTLWRLGVGAVDVRTLIDWELKTLVANVLVANLAQPILSLIYFIYNGVFTCMLAEREWNQFGQKRGGLRITSIPSGSQRSSYFLQLPYRFAIPIMLLSGLLHWLVSQSLFLVAVETWDQGKRLDRESWSQESERTTTSPDWLTCGYSPMAIIFVIILAVFMMVLGIGIGMKRYGSGIPVGGSCSVVLSAACHVEDEKIESSKMASKPLQWGCVPSGGSDGVGHCAFSDATVTFPQQSVLYAGKS